MNLIKSPLETRRSQRGFTLVEILVVIAIIAILASAFIVAANLAINTAKRAKANVIANQIQTAILNYQTEYGLYPVPSSTPSGTDLIYSLPSGSAISGTEAPLMIALCGNVNAYNPSATATSTVPNTRQIAYLTPKRTDVDSGGVLLNPFSSGAAYYYFGISMDSDYSGILGDTGGAAPPNFSGWTTGSAAPTPVNIDQGVAVWACCDVPNLGTPSSSKSPQFWIHTY